MYGLLWAVTLKYLMLLTNIQVPFRTIYALAGYAYLPKVLGMALTSVLAFINPERLPIMSGAILLPDEWSNGAFYRLVDWFDPFSVWGIALLIVGLRTMTGKPFRAVALLVLGPWFAAALLFTAMG